MANGYFVHIQLAFVASLQKRCQKVVPEQSYAFVHTRMCVHIHVDGGISNHIAIAISVVDSNELIIHPAEMEDFPTSADSAVITSNLKKQDWLINKIATPC